MNDDDLGSMTKDELREVIRSLSAKVDENSAKWCKSEEQKMRAMNVANSARIRIQSVQAIRHLKRHMPEALGTNAEPNIDIALIEAAKDIDRADELADVLPF
jgi:hypothetical protein